MKFTQAIVLATVASAAVVSAVHTKGRAAGRVQRHNRAGKKSSLNSVHRFGSSALRHAGGIEGAASAAASLYSFRQSRKAQKAAEASDEAPVARAIAESIAVTDQTTTPHAATTGNGHRKTGQHKHQHNGKSFHHRVSGAAGRVTPGKKPSHKHSKAGPIVNAAAPATTSTVPTTKLPAPITARDLSEELESLDARDLEVLEELVARGRLSGVIRVARKGLGAARKAFKGRKMDTLMAAGTLASMMPSRSSNQPQQRDLGDFDELEMRDFDFELNELD